MDDSMENEQIKSIYERQYGAKPSALDKDDYPLEYLLLFLPKNKRSFILDAGCGNGRYANYLANLGYTNVFAVDLFDRIETAGKFKYFQSSIDKLHFDTNMFDFILCNSVIYYLENPISGIIELGRVLKVNGSLMLTAHTKYSIYTLNRIMRRNINKKKYTHLQDVKFYSIKYYVDSLKSNGFQIVRKDGYSHLSLIFRLYRKIYSVITHKSSVTLIKVNKKNSFLSSLRCYFAYHCVIISTKSGYF